MITARDASAVQQLVAADRGVDELEAIARVAKLGAEQVDQLAIEVTVRRVARTSSFDRASSRRGN